GDTGGSPAPPRTICGGAPEISAGGSAQRPRKAVLAGPALYEHGRRLSGAGANRRSAACKRPCRDIATRDTLLVVRLRDRHHHITRVRLHAETGLGPRLQHRPSI